MKNTATIRTLVPQHQQQHVLQQPAIRQENGNDIFTVVKASVGKAILDLNWKEPGDIEYLTKELTRMIQLRFPSIRLIEIPKAIEKGIRKEYGDYHGLSVVTFENFISSYLKSAERIEMGKEIARLSEPKEPSDDDKFTLAKNLVLDALEAKKRLQIITSPSISIYDFLDRLKLIPFTIDEKWQFIREAEDELKTEKSFESSIERDRNKRNNLVAFLERLQSKQEPDAVKQRAKRIAVNEYLASCLLDEIDIEVLIESKREFYKSMSR